MLKNLLVLALLFGVFPVQGHCGTAKAKHRAGNQQPAPQTAPVADQKPASTSPQTESQKQNIDEIRVIVPSSKDAWDKGAVCISGLLAIVAIFGIIYAAKTLGAIKRQADTMDSQAEHMANQLAEMKRQAEFSAKELGASQRPWISPTVVISGPLKNSHNGPIVTVDITLENVGKTPAVGIDIRPIFYPMNVNKPNPVTERNRVCEELTKGNADWGTVIFPDKTFTQRWTFGTTPEDVEVCKIGDRYCVEIIICVGYRSTFDEDARYYTGVSYTLSKFVENPTGVFCLKVGEELPIEGMRLYASSLSPIIAK